MAKTYHVTFQYIDGKSNGYEITPERGITGIKDQIKKFRWYEVSNTEIINLDNVLSIVIEEIK